MKEVKEQELQDMAAETAAEISKDCCTYCGTPTTAFPYIISLPLPFGFLECPSCGGVFVPLSIRRQKIAIAKRAESGIILPNEPL